MAEVINMPRLSDTMEEGTLAKWFKKVGDSVKEGEILAEIETDKATMEFESFHESINLAALWKLPVIYIVENNGYAMGTSVARTTSQEDLWKLGEPYEMPSMPVDGMDPVKVAEAIDKCVKHARDGKGPSLLDIKTYRYRGHSMSDAQQYRTKDEVEEYRKIDPISQVEKIIISKKYGTKSDIEKIDKKVKAIITDCEEFAESSPFPDKSLMYDVVYEQKDYPFIKHKID